MKPWLAGLISVVAGAAVALPLTIGVTAGLAGVLWIFVFGDDTWPAWVDPAFVTVVTAFALLSWAGIAWIIWLKLRPRPATG